jgi:hypothetical protein
MPRVFKTELPYRQGADANVHGLCGDAETMWEQYARENPSEYPEDAVVNGVTCKVTQKVAADGRKYYGVKSFMVVSSSDEGKVPVGLVIGMENGSHVARLLRSYSGELRTWMENVARRD